MAETPILSVDDRGRIAAAIAAAEAATRGEIYCVVARRSSEYRHVPFSWAGLLALTVPAGLAALGVDVAAFAPWRTLAWRLESEDAYAALTGFVVLQTLVFLGVAALAWPAAIRARLTPPWRARDRVRRAALAQFLSHGVLVTAGRTGVLLYLSMAERRAEVVADAAIYEKVSPAVWSETVALLADGARRGAAADGFEAAIAKAGAVLAEHFPPAGNDHDELSNHIVEI